MRRMRHFVHDHQRFEWSRSGPQVHTRSSRATGSRKREQRLDPRESGAAITRLPSCSGDTPGSHPKTRPRGHFRWPTGVSPEYRPGVESDRSSGELNLLPIMHGCSGRRGFEEGGRAGEPLARRVRESWGWESGCAGASLARRVRNRGDGRAHDQTLAINSGITHRLGYCATVTPVI
jgi:hypothetical protein